MRTPLLFAALSASLLSACYSAGDGQPPPLNSLYFPTGLALDALPSGDPSKPDKAAHLYVASSDFDLQYRASALAAYDLDQLAALLPQSCNSDSDCTHGHCDNDSSDPSFLCSDGTSACGELGEHSAADLLLYPGRCQSVDLTRHPEVIADTVQIGAFATDVIFRPLPQELVDGRAGRLFLPVRGDATLHWVDIQQTTGRLLDCGQANTSDNSCDGHHRIGDDAGTESVNRLRQEPEPFAVAIDDGGDNVVITNQTTGSVSLYANYWEAGATPLLVSVLTGLPTAPVGIAAVPKPAFADDPTRRHYEPGFLVVYENAPEVDLLRVHDAAMWDQPNADGADYSPRVLNRAGAVAISANSIGSDSRGIAIDDTERRKDYAACDLKCGTDSSCLDPCRQAVHQPSVYVSNRAPASLLVGALTADFSYASGTSELPSFTDSVPLTVGASRVVLGKIRVPGTTYTDDAGVGYDLEQRVFVTCFDSRRVYIYDPGRRALDSIVKTGRGPFALAIDEARGLGYVAHFTDSYLGVISLDQRFPKNYASIIGSVGVPSPPRASK